MSHQNGGRGKWGICISSIALVQLFWICLLNSKNFSSFKLIVLLIVSFNWSDRTLRSS